MTHIFVSTLFVIWSLGVTSNALPDIKLPEGLSSLCPYTSFCNVTGDRTGIPNSLKPCCGSCSCGRDCGKTHDCCTDDLDTYRLDEKGMSSCIKAAIHGGDTDPPGVVWYHMIDACPSGQKCNTTDISATDGFFPHTSLDDGFIYFNSACGECNGATKLLPWRVGIVWLQINMISLVVDFALGVENLLHNQIETGDCFLHFIPPTEVEITTEECYPESRIVRECLADESFLSGQNTFETYQKLCKSFNATYHVSGAGNDFVFANIYCALCSGRKVDTSCSIDSKPTKAPSGSVLLLIDSSYKNIDDLMPQRNELCEQDNCRTIYCPTGHIQLGKECSSEYRMIGARFMLHIELRFSGTTERPPANFYENFTDDNLKRWSLQSWKAFIIVAKEWEKDYTSFLIAILHTSRENVLYSRFLNSIKKALALPWQLRYLNQTYDLFATFNTHIVYFEAFTADNLVTLTTGIGVTDYSLESLQTSYHYFMDALDWDNFNKDMSGYGQAVYITKMAFCRLIELETNEYTENAALITLTSSNRTLGEGEFLRVKRLGGEIRPRICWQDLYPPDNRAENIFPYGVLVLVTVNTVYSCL